MHGWKSVFKKKWHRRWPAIKTSSNGVSVWDLFVLGCGPCFHVTVACQKVSKANWVFIQGKRECERWMPKSFFFLSAGRNTFYNHLPSLNTWKPWFVWMHLLHDIKRLLNRRCFSTCGAQQKNTVHPTTRVANGMLICLFFTWPSLITPGCAHAGDVTLVSQREGISPRQDEKLTAACFCSLCLFQLTFVAIIWQMR